MPLKSTTKIAVVGDLIGPDRPVTPLRDSETEQVFSILRSVDAAVGNHEGSAFDLDAFTGARAAVNGGGYPLATPAATRDLGAMGISMLTKANNHALDWGKRGMFATLAELDQSGIASAGAGSSRESAQRPAYFETPAGRIALVSLASTYVDIAQAGEAGGAFAARPGIFSYRTRAITAVLPEDFDVLRRIANSQGIGDGEIDGRAHLINDDILLGQEWFRSSTTPGLIYEPNEQDHRDLLTAVRFAKQTADIVVVGLHAHETATGSAADRCPPEFVTRLHHDCIDEGADLAFTTGPHVVRGLEIYRGKPIFYGMASFFLELETGHGSNPDDLRAAGKITGEKTPGEDFHDAIPVPVEWYDSIIAEVEFSNGQLLAGRVYPLRLSQHESPRLQGHPRLAQGEDARRILEQFRADSDQFQTSITIGESTATLDHTEVSGSPAVGLDKLTLAS